MLTITENLSQLYEKDYILWLEKNIQFIKDGKFKYVDLENLIEELETLGRSEKNAIKSLIRQILIHLLMYQYWTQEHERNSHHWRIEIRTFRQQLKDRVTSNLKNYVISELDDLYQDAVEIVIDKSSLTCFPAQCPYTFDQILDKNWLPLVSE